MYCKFGVEDHTMIVINYYFHLIEDITGIYGPKRNLQTSQTLQTPTSRTLSYLTDLYDTYKHLAFRRLHTSLKRKNLTTQKNHQCWSKKLTEIVDIFRPCGQLQLQSQKTTQCIVTFSQRIDTKQATFPSWGNRPILVSFSRTEISAHLGHFLLNLKDKISHEQ